MTDAEFTAHFKRLEDKYPNYFQNDDHRSREYADFYDNFHKLDNQTTKEAFDYYFRYLARGWFPPVPDMLNCYNLMHKQQPEVTDEKIKRGSIRPLYNAIEKVKKRIAASEIPVGFTDNNFQDSGYPAKYTAVNSLAECLVQMWENNYVKPAIADYKKAKLAEKRVNRPVSDLVECAVDLGKYKSSTSTEWVSREVKQKHCYYCEKRVLKDGGVFKCAECNVEYK